jgi:protein-S-isoprenylcysteine O-methyltransferase Ste14
LKWIFENGHRTGMTTRLALPIALAAFFGLTLILPLLRQKRRIGSLGVALRLDQPVERLLALFMGAFLVAAAAWVAVFVVAGPAPLGVVEPPRALAATGWALVALGLSATAWAQAHMGASWRIGVDERPTALVTSGPFGVVRNPIYSALLAAVAGLAAVAPSAGTVGAWLVVAAAIAVQTRREERHLVALHGAAYLEYAARVGRFLPGLGRLRR